MPVTDRPLDIVEMTPDIVNPLDPLIIPSDVSAAVVDTAPDTCKPAVPLIRFEEVIPATVVKDH